MASPPDPDADLHALRDRLSAAEAKAVELEEWLAATFESSPVAMGIVSSLENRYLRANAALAELYDMPVEEILNADPFALGLHLTHPDDLFAEQKLFAELAAGTRRSYRIEKRIVRRDGSLRFGLLTFAGIFEPTVDPTKSASALRFVVLQIVDISAQKAMAETLQHRDEELRHAQKIDGIGRLAAGIAHDFNNLLTVIIGHGEVLKILLRDGAEALSVPDAREDLDAILAAAERAASLTAQLLAHGRREAVNPRTFVLSEAVEALQRLLRRIIGSHIDIEQTLSATGAIYADQGQVGQVVMNLLLNARDAIPDGGHIRLATRDVVVKEGEGALPEPGEWVAVIVSDTGHGMTPDIQARMFDPFFTTRGDRPGTQGTGLGLATVQRIVAESGGRIAVTSAPGEGTTVTIFFPRVSKASTVDPSPTRQHVQPAPNSVRVLVVEDEPSVRALVGNVLLGDHYWVMVARDGEEALRLVEAERDPFDLIVTDLTMPHVGGATLAERLHERGSPPRFLFISGYSDQPPTDLLPYGKLLPKPFTPAQLLMAVRSALEESDGIVSRVRDGQLASHAATRCFGDGRPRPKRCRLHALVAKSHVRSRFFLRAC